MKEKIKISHCVLKDYMITTRRSWDFNNKRFKNGYKYFPIPLRFKDILLDKAMKWKKDFIEFTVAHDLENEICAIAIVHPKDNFCKKVGYKIVTGRLRRTTDEIKPYVELPATVHKLK